MPDYLWSSFDGGADRNNIFDAEEVVEGEATLKALAEAFHVKQALTCRASRASPSAPLAPQALETGDFGYRGDLLVVHGITEAGEPL